MNRYLPVEEVQLVHSGSHFFDLSIRLIGQAKQEVHLQTYIFEGDDTGLRVADALAKAAMRGVKVHVLVDAIGSFPFSKQIQNQFDASGVKFRLFSPLFSTENIFAGRRLHHKLLVCDRYHALVGGINIANKYNNTHEGEAWLDYAVYTRGGINEYLHLFSEQFYYKKRNNGLRAWEKKQPEHLSAGPPLLRYRVNDWIRRKNEIHRSYMQVISKSQTSLTIVASYFLPGRRFRNLLAKASKRGVKIRLIMAGRSDLSSVRLAENYLYDYYLRNKIELFEWKNSVMHGKAMIVDGKWATVGSYNLNFLSHYASVELNAEIDDLQFVRYFESELEKITSQHCNGIDFEKYCEAQPWHNKFLKWLAYYFFRFIKTITLLGSRRSKLHKQ